MSVPVTMIEVAQATVAAADIFVIVGSALEVYPAAELVKYACASASIYLINPNEVRNQGRSMTVIREKATTGMEKLKNILTETPSETPKETPKDGKANTRKKTIVAFYCVASIPMQAQQLCTPAYIPPKACCQKTVIQASNMAEDSVMSTG